MNPSQTLKKGMEKSMKTKLSIGGEVVEFAGDCLDKFQTHLQSGNHVSTDISIPQLLYRHATKMRVGSVLGRILLYWFVIVAVLCAVVYVVYSVKCNIHPDIILMNFIASMPYVLLTYVIMVVSALIWWQLFVAKRITSVNHIESALRQIHPEGELLPEYSPDAIELYLKMLANRCIADEQAFDRARLDTGRPVDQILQTGKEYQAARESLNQAIEGCNTIFEMSWSRAELLRAAQARFDAAIPT